MYSKVVRKLTILKEVVYISKNSWKIGELAKQTGLTVRTLYHYDQIGLLSPSFYTESGHRIYNESDIAKLQQIILLKQLGFSLEEIKEIIENPDFEPIELIKSHLDRLKEFLRIQEQIYNKLEEIHELLDSRKEVKSEQFIKLIEVINMKDKYFSQEQLEKMKKQFEQIGPEKRKQHEMEWSQLVAEIRKEFEKGTPPENLNVIQLVKRWNEFINLVTGGDKDIIKTAEHYYKENPEIAHQYGIDKQFYEYILKATSHI